MGPDFQYVKKKPETGRRLTEAKGKSEKTSHRRAGERAPFFKQGVKQGIGSLRRVLGLGEIRGTILHGGGGE